MTTTRFVLGMVAAICGGVALGAQQALPARPDRLGPQGPQVVAPPRPAAQPPDNQRPVFRTQVNYVEIDVTVSDSKGQPVTDLTADDFEIKEGNDFQKIADFSFVNIPIERQEAPLRVEGKTVERDVQSNQRAEGRVYLIVLDNLHIQATRTMAAKTAARKFITDHLGPNDVAAVLFTGAKAQDAQDFTNDRELLVKAIDRMVGRKGEADLGNAEMNERVESNSTRMVMKELGKLTDFLRGVRGHRKALLFVSEGMDASLDDPMADSSSVILDMADATSTAARSNIAIYPIDPRGLDSGFDVSSMSGESRESQRNDQEGLRTIAANTGGFAIANTNNFGGGFDRLVAENSSYYLLGYYVNEPTDGRFRKVDVRVKRQGLRVRVRGSLESRDGRKPSSSSRRPAAAPAPGAKEAPNAITDASRSPVSVGDVAMKVYAGAYKNAGSKTASVALVTEVDISRFDFAEADGRITNQQLVLRYLATDSVGKVRQPIERFTIDLKMRPGTFERAKERGLRVVSQMSLPPGRYQLRIAAGHTAREAGSVVYDFEVPDFWKEQLSLSGVMIASKKDADVLTIRPNDPDNSRWWSAPRFVATPPTTLREFATGDTLALMTEFYAKDRKTLRSFTARAELLGADGKVVRQIAKEGVSPKDLDAERYEFSPELSLEGVAPGRYVVRVEGRSSNGQEASRNIEIRVK